MIYFDNAATTPMCDRALEAMTKALKEDYGNPSSIHAAGRKSRAHIEKARKNIAQGIHAETGEIYFTSCGTESNNTALKNSVRDLDVELILSSPIEHHSVLHTLEAIEKSGKAAVHYLEIDDTGRVKLEGLEEQLMKHKGKNILVSIMHANNEIGTVNDLEKIGNICKEHGAYFHSDCVQTLTHLPIDVKKFNLSFLSGSAHKFHGPKGTGILFMKKKNKLHPFIHGGGQEREMRAGTENIAGIMGLNAAFTDAMEHFDDYCKKVRDLRTYFKKNLIAEINGIQFNGCQENYLQTILNVCFPPHPKNNMLLLNLDLHGICASSGSACSSGADTGSHVLKAINCDQADKVNIRFSFSHLNKKAEVDTTIKVLKDIFALKPVA